MFRFALPSGEVCRWALKSDGILRFAVFEVDLRSGELRKQGVRVKLQDQPFQVLKLLLQRSGELVTMLDASLDRWRQSYRRINLSFAAFPSERELRIAGVEKVRTEGHRISIFASQNADAVIARARDLSAVSVDVAPVGLRDIFLETVQEN